MHEMRVLVALVSLALAGCEMQDNATPTAQTGADGNTGLAELSCKDDEAHDHLTAIPMMDRFAPVAAIAISAAANVTDQGSASIMKDYCLFDRNLNARNKRCFIFLPRVIQPGGEIYLCVTSKGEATDLYLGE